MQDGTTSAYRQQIDQQRIQDIRDICRGLPPTCGDFLRSIALTTGTFTRLAYALDLRTFFQFLQRERAAFSDKPLYSFDDSDLQRISQSDLTAYIEYLTFYYRNQDAEDGTQDLKPMVNHELSIKRKLSSLRSYFDYLFKNHHVSANVTTLVDLPKIHEKPIIRLSQEEMTRLLTQAETGESLTEHQKAYQKITAKRDVAILSLFLGTGIRVSECVGINLSDVDFEQNAFLVTRKGGNQVVLYFPDEVAAALQDYLEQRMQIEALPGHEDAFFLSMQRRRITQRAVQNLVKKYAAIAAPLKPKISPHKLRSTFATNLYHATGDIYLVADVLGHSSVDTTRKHYADMTDERRRKAAQFVTLPERENAEEADETDEEKESAVQPSEEKPETAPETETPSV